jgi:hypothetical protein
LSRTFIVLLKAATAFGVIPREEGSRLVASAYATTRFLASSD